jgi:hypothetical protein
MFRSASSRQGYFGADAAIDLSHYLAVDPEPMIVADWPEDIAQFCNLLMTGPGEMVPVPRLTFDLVPLSGFSTAANSAGAAQCAARRACAERPCVGA